MSSKKIPVSFEFFKKHTTNHEELVDVIFKSKAKENLEMYEIYKNSAECREKALTQYYEAFYLNPQIREKNCICLKPMPKHIKEELLQIPPMTINISDDNEPKNEGCKSHDTNKSNIVETPNNLNTQNEQTEAQQRATTSNNVNMSELNYKDLLAYEHCCPVQLEDLKNNTNIVQLISEANQKKYGKDESMLGEVLHRFYLQFYLQPERLRHTLFCKRLKVNDNCPADLKRKLFELPANTYLKVGIPQNHDSPLKETICAEQQQNKAQQKTTTSNNVNTSQLIYKDLIAYEHCCPVQLEDFEKYTNITQLMSESCQKKYGKDTSMLKENLHRFYLKFYLQPEIIRSKTCCNRIKVNDNCPADIKSKLFEIPTNIYLKDDIPQNPVSTVKGQQNMNLLCLPVSYDDFKKHAFYEELVDKIFKLKSKDNENIYQELTNSETAKEQTFREYYEAFYLKPKIRETMPIRFRPMPRKLKDKLLQIPIQADVFEEVNILDSNLAQNHTSPRTAHNDAYNHLPQPPVTKRSLKTNDRPACKLIKLTNVEIEKDNNLVNDMETDVRTQQALDEESQNKTQDAHKSNIVETQNDLKVQKEPAEQPQTTSKSVNVSQLNYKDLLAYEHYCPVQLEDLKNNTNIVQLIREANQKKYGKDESMLGEVLHRFYLQFYLQPERLRHTFFCKRLKVNVDCPSDLKRRLFEIPANINLKVDIPQSQLKFKDLLAYEHCCPVALREFEKYTNIAQLLSGSYEKRCGNDKSKFWNLLHLMYLKFYLQPKDIRYSNLFCNRFKVNDNCPLDFKMKLFEIPENIYLLPMSYDEFKYYAYYEEQVDKIMQLKSKDHENLYPALLSLETAKEMVFREYYHAFYLKPEIRETIPIRFRPMSKNLKMKLLQIPRQAELLKETNNNKNKNIEEQNPSVKHQESNKQPDKCSLAANTDNGTAANDAGDESINQGCLNKSETQNDLNNQKDQAQQLPPATANNVNISQLIYKDLIAYEHCCPVQLEDFEKYTNITQLMSESCQKKYGKDTSMLKENLHRFYLKFYLQPEIIRSKTCCNRIKVNDNCPADIKSKLFEIPTNIYLKDDIPQNPVSTVKGQQNMNLLCLPVSYDDFKKHAFYEELVDKIFKLKSKDNENIYQELTNSETAKEQTFRQYYEAFYLKPKIRETMPIRFRPMPRKLKDKLLQIPIQADVFEEVNIHDSNLAENHTSPSTTQYDASNHLPQTPATKRSLPNNDRPTCKRFKSTNMEIEKADNLEYNMETDIQKQQDTNPDVIQISTKQSVIILENRLLRRKDKSLLPSNIVTTTTESSFDRTETTNTVGTNTVKPRILEARTDACNTVDPTKEAQNLGIPKDETKRLLNKRTFNKCRAKIIKQCTEPFDCTSFPVTFDHFKESNQIPLEDILNDFTQQNEEISRILLIDKELCDALLHYYYIKYHTSRTLHKKYPLKTRRADSTATAAAPGLSGNSQQQLNSVTSKANLAIGTRYLEGAKRIFFRPTDKCHSLSYLLRTTFGLKHNIIRALFSMTFEEFRNLTYVYEGKLLYHNSSDDLKHMYTYVFLNCQIWPTNLFITIYDLCKFLQTKNITFSNYSTMLMYISPKFLHWSNLCICTNFEDCVSADYQRRTGNPLNVNDDALLQQEFNNHYNRCWKFEKWIGDTPLVYEQFVETLMEGNCSNADVTMLNVSDLQEVCESSLEPSKNIATVELSDTVITEDIACYTTESTKTPNLKDPSTNLIADHNYVLLPNTQQQIAMLPVEVDGHTSDPLNQSGCMSKTINISADGTGRILNDSVEMLSSGDLEICVKNDSSDIKPLKDLLFYEDDDSNIQCTPCVEEIVVLDDSSDLLYSQSPTQLLLNSPDSDCDALINLGQRLPSSADSIQSMQHKSLTFSTQHMQQLDVNLTSSGSTNDNLKSQEEQQHEVQTEGQMEILFNDSDMSDIIGLQNFPNDLAQLKSLPSSLDFNMSKEHITQSPLQLSSLISANQPNMNTFQEAQRLISSFEESPTKTTISKNTLPETQIFPSSIEDSQTSTSTPPTTDSNNKNFNTERNANVTLRKPIKKITSTPPIFTTLPESQDFTGLLENSPTSIKALQRDKDACAVRQNANVMKKPIVRECVVQTAKVKTLKNSNFVEQRQHPIRPLQQTRNPVPTIREQKESTTLAQLPDNNVPQLIYISSSTSTQIQISQELTTNCTLFNNTSLLKMIDQNYQLSQSSVSTLLQRELPQEIQQSMKLRVESIENGTTIPKTLDSHNSKASSPLASAASSSSTSSSELTTTTTKTSTRRNSTHKDVESNENFYLRNKKSL